MNIRRINKELEKMTNYKIDNYIFYDNSLDIFLNEKVMIKIIFNNSYPFTRPKVYIRYDGKIQEYNNFTHLKYPRFISQLDKQNKKCFCSETIMCKDWRPSYKIIDIIKDVKNTGKLIRQIIYYSYTDVICNKYYIPNDIVELIQKYL